MTKDYIASSLVVLETTGGKAGNVVTQEFVRKINVLLRAHLPTKEQDMQAAGYYRTREIIVHRYGLYGNIMTLCPKYGADLEMIQKSVLKIQRYQEKTVQSLVREIAGEGVLKIS